MNDNPAVVPSSRRWRTKPIYPRYAERDGVFRIGMQRGLTLELVDPEGQLWQLTDLLDGERDLTDVIIAMRAAHPSLTPDDVLDAIRRLDDAGLLDDGAPSRYDRESARSRYLGNVNYFSHFVRGETPRGAFQDVLCDTRVTLFGLGGGGSTVLQLLLAVGVGGIRAVDHDRVETTNLNRQLLFEESSVGQLKTDAAREFSTRRNSLIDFEFVPQFIDSPATAARLVTGSDVVICAIDEPPGIVQRVVNKACVAAGVPCVFGMSQVSRGRVFTVVPGESGCVDCLYSHYDAVDSGWARRFRNVMALEDRPPTLAYGPNLMRICAELVDELVRVRTGYLPPRSVGVQLEMDFETGGTYPLTQWAWERTPDCPTCGNGDEFRFARRIGSPALSMA